MTVRNPMSFFETDLSKLITDMKMPGVDVETVLASQRKNIDAVTEANRLAMEGMQTVMRRQAEILRTMLDEMSSASQELMASSAPEDKVVKQTELLQAQFEKVLSNMRELTELVAKSNNECAEVLTKRFSESLSELREQVETAKKAAK